MIKDSKYRYNPIDVVISITGLVIIVKGFDFIANNLVSSGFSMGPTGINGIMQIDGTGMVFCGLIIFGGGIAMFFEKRSKIKKSKKNQQINKSHYNK